MGRLIDANLLKKNIAKWLQGGDPQENKMVKLDDIVVSVIMEIDEQPTAYSIEKVVAELEHEADLQDYLRQNACSRCNVAQANIHRYAEQCYRNKAIEIVRKGGVNG